MKKRILSLALALVICLGLLPTAVLAADTYAPYTVTTAEGNTVTFEAAYVKTQEVVFGNPMAEDLGKEPTTREEVTLIVVEPGSKFTVKDAAGSDARISCIGLELADSTYWMKMGVYWYLTGNGCIDDIWEIGKINWRADMLQIETYRKEVVDEETGEIDYIDWEYVYVIPGDMTGSSAVEDPAAEETVTAARNDMTVKVDGRNVQFAAYGVTDANGGFTNYVKLRDIAYVLNNSAAQFSVDYDNASRTIIVETGKPYVTEGTEMKDNFAAAEPCDPAGLAIQIDGKDVSLNSFVLYDQVNGASTYIKLRDLGAALDFNVSWIDDYVVVNTDQSYSDAQ